MERLQDVVWYRRWAKRVKEKFMQYNSGEATLTQLDATINQLPSATMSVSCETLEVLEVEFGFGLRRATLGKEAWMNPHQFITLPQAFLDHLAMESELLKNWCVSTDNEIRARTIITKLLEAVYKELRLEGFAGPEEIRMREETTFSFYPMKFTDGRKPCKVRCVGRTDLSFNFGDEEAQAINLVVVDVNHSRASHGGQGQILAYMAMGTTATKPPTLSVMRSYNRRVPTEGIRYDHNGNAINRPNEPPMTLRRRSRVYLLRRQQVTQKHIAISREDTPEKGSPQGTVDVDQISPSSASLEHASANGPVQRQTLGKYFDYEDVMRDYDIIDQISKKAQAVDIRRRP
ncbi:uncharacterized protein PGRI_069610 [Penicillium griseofulvum]|uniref:Uncharacterized protein n=1 Tax=Penicillium patulum TaxID=5078 RepID=A0A135LNC6_PENPA|nr:uncharacterized protein PGRI_069610 [Penicillium griseofulvum]KXG50470.1 hypothetical protein PGRI_069610 [Penicillium griseofulvum]